MSDKKIDRLDQRITELVNITGNVVIGIRELNQKFESLDAKVDTLSKQQKITDKRADRTNAILEEALFRIIDLQKGQNGIVPRVENLEDRVDIIEKKIAV